MHFSVISVIYTIWTVTMDVVDSVDARPRSSRVTAGTGKLKKNLKLI